MNIKVEILPWFSTALRPKETGRIVVEHDLAGSTFRDLLREMAETDPAVASVIFDLEKGEMRYPALGVLNDRLLEFAGGLDAKLREGDSVTLMAAYTGG